VPFVSTHLVYQAWWLPGVERQVGAANYTEQELCRKRLHKLNNRSI